MSSWAAPVGEKKKNREEQASHNFDRAQLLQLPHAQIAHTHASARTHTHSVKDLQASFIWTVLSWQIDMEFWTI